ncbi:MAG: osmotically inducible protein OsmC [Kangiella sp.]|nr:MAG: osmotically inducible protein OsmC [Kangiella sp.]
MNALPHIYIATAKSEVTSNLDLTVENLPALEIAPPIGFNGPGDKWSPEDLLMASVASCTILSFKAIAKASKMEWISLKCVSEGVLDRIERKTQFTKITTKAVLTIPVGGNKEKAVKLLHKAEETCLISNSLTAKSDIECEVLFG